MSTIFKTSNKCTYTWTSFLLKALNSMNNTFSCYLHCMYFIRTVLNKDQQKNMQVCQAKGNRKEKLMRKVKTYVLTMVMAARAKYFPNVTRKMLCKYSFKDKPQMSREQFEEKTQHLNASVCLRECYRTTSLIEKTLSKYKNDLPSIEYLPMSIISLHRLPGNY